MSRLGWAGLLLAVAFPVLTGFHPYYLYLLGTGYLLASLASAWGLLAYAGQISFGHAAFFGLGAYTAALLALRAGLTPWLGILAGGLAAALAALPIGASAHLLRGAYLALGSLAYAEIFRVVALNWSGLTGGGAGLIGLPALPALPLGVEIARERAGGYYLSLALLLVALAVFAGLRRSRLGLAWAAIREREERAQILGVSPTPCKLLAFACSAALTGLAGGLYAHSVRFIEPDLVFGRYFSILPLVMATFGGLHTLLGPPVGALCLYLVSELLFHPLLPRLHQLPYALALIGVILYLPRGLAGLVGRR